MPDSTVSIVRGLTLTVVAAFLCVLGYFLVQPGFTWMRFAFFAVLAGLAVGGAVGLYRERELLTVGAAVGLLLLGFWQAVLWLFILPVAVVLAVGVVLVANQTEAATNEAGEPTERGT